MAPRLLFLLENAAVILFWFGLSIVFYLPDILGFFEGIWSQSTIIYLVLLTISCGVLAYCYRRYARIYLKIQHHRSVFWLIFLSSTALFLSLFCKLQYTIGTYADNYIPDLASITSDIVYFLAGCVLLFTFMVFIMRKPLAPLQVKTART